MRARNEFQKCEGWKVGKINVRYWKWHGPGWLRILLQEVDVFTAHCCTVVTKLGIRDPTYSSIPSLLHPSLIPATSYSAAASAANAISFNCIFSSKRNTIYLHVLLSVTSVSPWRIRLANVLSSLNCDRLGGIRSLRCSTTRFTSSINACLRRRLSRPKFRYNSSIFAWSSLR